MKKKLLSILLVLTLILAACGASKEGQKASEDGKKVIKIGVSPVPHEEIAKIAKEELAKEGIELEIKVFDDYVQPNLAVKDKDLDANFFQHVPYMESFNKENGTNIVSVGGVHVEPIAFYSKKVKSLDELKDGAEIIIPNDATNGARALLLLEKNGLIELKDGVDLPTVLDIEKNPKNIKFTEVEAALITGSYEQVDGAVINSNYAISKGLNPLKDGIVIEDKESDYANVISVNADRKDDPDIQKLYKAFSSERVKKFLEEKYKGAIVPAF